MLVYPAEGSKGRSIGWFWAIFNSGNLIGSLVSSCSGALLPKLIISGTTLEQLAYRWGFSFGLLRIFACMTSVFLTMMAIMWQDANTKSVVARNNLHTVMRPRGLSAHDHATASDDASQLSDEQLNRDKDGFCTNGA